MPGGINAAQGVSPFIVTKQVVRALGSSGHADNRNDVDAHAPREAHSSDFAQGSIVERHLQAPKVLYRAREESRDHHRFRSDYGV